MASVVTYDGGLRRIEFSLTPNGPRTPVRLGRISQRDADTIRVHVERIVEAKINAKAIPNSTAAWLNEIGEKLSARLADAGLIPKRASSALGAFIDEYVKSRGDTKPATIVTYKNVRRCLVDHFGADKALQDVTPGDADKFRLWLVTHEKLADNTVRRRLGIARQFFKVALRRRLILANPFEGLAASVRGNPDKFRFVTRAEADAVLTACPDAQWRAAVALVRYGGLRCPSELVGLTWQDLDWEKCRLLIHSPKTSHHPGGAARIIPIFPELLPYLRDAFEAAEEGAVHVVPRLRDPTVNLRTTFTKIIKRAGIVPWPKLFVNLRASRAIELRQMGFPDHVVNAWLGHTASVAAEFYLRVTDDDFERAIGTQAHQKAHQKAQQSVAESSREKLNDCGDKADKPCENEKIGASAQVPSSSLKEGGWAILDSNQ